MVTPIRGRDMAIRVRGGGDERKGQLVCGVERSTMCVSLLRTLRAA